MQLVTLQREGYTEPGIITDDGIAGLQDAGFDDMLSLIAGGEDSLDRVRRRAANPPRGDLFDPATATPSCYPGTRPSPTTKPSSRW